MLGSVVSDIMLAINYSLLFIHRSLMMRSLMMRADVILDVGAKST